MTHRARARLTEGSVEVLYEGNTVAALSHSEAVTLALHLLALTAAHPGAEAYRAVEWVAVGDVMRTLGLTRSSASRLVARFQTVHTRVPGGDRYVARAEVDAWAARALGAVRRRKSA